MNSITPDRLKDLLEKARATREVADGELAKLNSALQEALHFLVPEGLVVDLHSLDLPAHLATLRTMSGSDRGTHIFRITQVLGVEASPLVATLTRWSCKAVPISEVTGKDMSASSGRGPRVEVILRGRLSYAISPNESAAAEGTRLIDELTHQKPAVSAPLPTARSTPTRQRKSR